MDRKIVYPGAIPQDTDILSTNQDAMIAIGYLAQAMVGTGTVVDGLVCAPTSPASLTVNVGPGTIFALEVIEANVYGSLPTDSDPLVKVGINPYGVTPFTLAPPGTSGNSINYLIEASFLETDGSSTVLPYYNASDPALPYSGPSNTGTSQNTLRTQRASLQLKAGAAATTGTQTTPAVDSGWVGLYVITINYGQTTIISSGIQLYPNAPFIPIKLPQLRTRLTAATTFYISASGSNSTGSGSSLAPWATLTYAWSYVAANIDCAGQAVTFKLLDGAYSSQSCSGPLSGAPAAVSVVGNTSNSANVTITGASIYAIAFISTGIAVNFGGVKLATTGSNNDAYGLAINYGAVVVALSSAPLIFGACITGHIGVQNAGEFSAVSSAYTIAGNAPDHLFVDDAGFINIESATITLTGTPAFSSAFAQAVALGVIEAASTSFSGSATGTRYTVALNAVIDTNGGGASFFPGNAAGSTSTGGQYA